jgi:serine/threonine-protein kinase HipA
VFNAVVGNDDDHPRNHAAVYRHQEGRWRLAPAFDVVPDPEATPKVLAMQLCLGRYAISRDAILADFLRFGFATQQEAGAYLNGLMQQIEQGFEQIAPILNGALRELMRARLLENGGKLKAAF